MTMGILSEAEIAQLREIAAARGQDDPAAYIALAVREAIARDHAALRRQDARPAQPRAAETGRRETPASARVPEWRPQTDAETVHAITLAVENEVIFDDGSFFKISARDPSGERDPTIAYGGVRGKKVERVRKAHATGGTLEVTFFISPLYKHLIFRLADDGPPPGLKRKRTDGDPTAARATA